MILAFNGAYMKRELFSYSSKNYGKDLADYPCSQIVPDSTTILG
jgi:hypothetical protein